MNAFSMKIASAAFIALLLLIMPISSAFAQVYAYPPCSNYYYPWGSISCSNSFYPWYYANQISAQAAAAASAITPSFSYPTYYTYSPSPFYLPSSYYIPSTYYWPSAYYSGSGFSPFLSIGIGGTWTF